MNNQDHADCSRWRVETAGRPGTFAALLARNEARSRARRKRMLVACAALMAFTATGATAGVAGAKRENAENLAQLRRVYLETVAPSHDR